jgi:hypothetical protein
MDMREFGLIARVRRAELNFEKLAEMLTTRGYITTLDKEPGVGFGRVQIDQTTQDDFNALFAVLMPGRLNDVRLLPHATCKGAGPGLYTTALFNLNVLDYDEMNALLIEINRGEL